MDRAFAIDSESLSAEFKLMLALMNTEHTSKQLQIAELVSGDLDWNIFLEIVMHHRVYPIVYQASRKYAMEWMPYPILNQLKNAYTTNRFRMLELAGEMERLCCVLHEEGITALLLKGPALALTLYGDLSLRTSKHLDILVPLEMVESAESILWANGYVLADTKPRILEDWKWRDHHISYRHRVSGIQVELHWQLSPGLSKEPSFFELWERRKSIPTFKSVNLLADGDLFYYLTIHGARHGWFRLRWLVDIDRLLSKSNVTVDLLTTIRTYNESDAAAGQAILLLEVLLQSPVTSTIQHLAMNNKSVLLAETCMPFIREMVQLCPIPATKELSKAYSRYMNILEPRRYVWMKSVIRLLPSSYDAQTLPLPKILFFLYYPLRPFLWLWRRMTKQQAGSLAEGKLLR